MAESEARASHVEFATAGAVRQIPADVLARVDHSLFAYELAERTFIRGKNAVIVITGESGSGKSWSSLSLASKLDPKFGRGDVFFNPRDLVESASSKVKRRGRVRMFDEAGVGLHNRNWRDTVNTTLIHFLQTWRVFGETLILTLPYPSFLDPQVWKMCQYWVEMSSVQLGAGVVKKVVPRDDLKGRPIHYHFLRTKLEDGRIVRAPVHDFSEPPPRLARWYESAAYDFKIKLQERLAVSLAEETRKNGGAAGKLEIAQTIAEAMKADPTKYRKTLKSGAVKVEAQLIRMDYGLSHVDTGPVVAKVRQILGL